MKTETHDSAPRATPRAPAFVADGWVLEVGAGGWVVAIGPAVGPNGPPFNVAVKDDAGKTRRLEYFCPNVIDAMEGVVASMRAAGVDFNERDLVDLARRLQDGTS